MPEAKIINRGRGPEIEGSRITVFDVLDYLQEGWPTAEIARLFHLNSSQVDAAVRYIDDHKKEVMEDYERILERCARGNPPELQAKLDAGHEHILAMARERLKQATKTQADLAHSSILSSPVSLSSRRA